MVLMRTRLPKRPAKPYIRPAHKEAKAMTIALGFPCIDGIVLCCDSQMTAPGQMKYHESKIHTITSLSDKNQWTVAITYSGDPNIMKSLYTKMRDRLLPHRETVDQEFVCETLQQTLIDVHNTSTDVDREFVDIICAVSVNDSLRMYVGKRTTLHEESDTAYSGAGDSSLSRFLAQTLPVSVKPMFTKNAQLLGVYIIEQAKLFVDGCGGDTYVATIAENGAFHFWDNTRLQHLDELTVLAKNIQRRIEETVLAITDSEYDEIELGKLENEIRRTKKQVNDFYGLGLG
jgi:hypothetical protein